jgi:signal transduction histidine kinase
MARGRAEHTRRQAEQARRRASEERVRIAQELHDVVAHNISLINVQAGVALHLMDSGGNGSPDQARAALAAIKQASKETLGELRSVLGILRAEPGEHAPLSPAAGLDQLDGLIAGATSAGLSVHTEVTGDRVPLPPSTDLAAYRIVQEALTNVIKHVGAAAVTVRLRYGETNLGIEVTDDGGTITGGATGAPSGAPSGAGIPRGAAAGDDGGDAAPLWFSGRRGGGRNRRR